MDPDNDLATFNRSGGIRNQNLYFSACLIVVSRPTLLCLAVPDTVA
jgi:hypothetical protein